ncbi:unnamed protein product, partial [Rangifer tarandus platyrhynchus]
MYSHIFRAARVNICRQRLLTPIPGRRGRRLALSAIKLFDVLVANCRDPGTTVKIVNTLISMFCRDVSPSADLGRFQSAGHLDSPNLLCGRYRCSPGLTSLSAPHLGLRPGEAGRVRPQAAESRSKDSVRTVLCLHAAHFLVAIYSSKPGGKLSTFRRGSNCNFAYTLGGN